MRERAERMEAARAFGRYFDAIADSKSVEWAYGLDSRHIERKRRECSRLLPEKLDTPHG